MRTTIIQRLAGVAVAAALLTVGAAQAADPLPKLSIDPKAISVSGLSSGAYMTIQMHVAHSGTFMGAGVVAGGPYYCAAGNIAYTAICMGQVPFAPPNPYLMYSAATGFDALGQIDPLSNLKTSKVYIFTGKKDTVVKPNAVEAARDFYQLAGVPDASIKYVDSVPAEHAFIAPAAAKTCGFKGDPYINKCAVDGQSYDQAGVLLQHIYGPLNPPAANPGGVLKPFSQIPYGADNPVSVLSPEGHVYIPAACTAADANCRLHVSIHGCGQNETNIGNDWYTDLNINNWADTNKIVVIYPQVGSATIPYNPKGCWDWWGYSGPAYAWKSGLQVAAIKAMVDAVSKP